MTIADVVVRRRALLAWMQMHGGKYYDDPACLSTGEIADYTRLYDDDGEDWFRRCTEDLTVLMHTGHVERHGGHNGNVTRLSTRTVCSCTPSRLLLQ